MPVFGHYETVRELYHSATTSLWTAIPAGSSADAAFAIKLLQPSEGLLLPEQIAPAIASFLARAQVQQKVAAQPNSHWLPIHESGQAGAGAYYVADLYPQSLHRLIAGHAKFTDEILYDLVKQVVAALDELFASQSRYHGNLKLHNVLIKGQPGTREFRIALTDPAADAADPSNDFFFIGELIYQAILHKPFKQLTAWPIAESEEWLTLGRRGERWRRLCSQLLSPDAADRPQNLGEMHKALRNLRLPLQSTSSRLVLAASVLVAAGGIFAAIHFRHPPQTIIIPATKPDTQAVHLAQLQDQFQAELHTLSSTTLPLFDAAAAPIPPSFFAPLREAANQLLATKTPPKTSAQLEPAIAQVHQANSALRDLTEFLVAHAREIDWPFFLSSHKPPAALADIPPLIDELKKPQFALLTPAADPRNTWKPAKPLDDAVAIISSLPADDPSRASLETTQQEISKSIAQVLSIPLDHQNLPQIQTGIQRLNQQIADLSSKANQTLALSNRPINRLRRLFKADQTTKSNANGKTILAMLATLTPQDRSSPDARLLLDQIRSYYQPAQLENSLHMRLVRIEPGTFTMGSPPTEAGRPKPADDDEAQFECTLSHPFYMGVYEVTRDQFAAFVADRHYLTEAQRLKTDKKGNKLKPWTAPGFEQGGDHPVVCMSYGDCVAFCEWLSAKEGRKYRLPTEFEWEYACRAGSHAAYIWGEDPAQGQGWLNGRDKSNAFAKPGNLGIFPWDDGFAFTSPVGKFKPNAWGLYDMAGNAWEWTGSWYGAYPKGAATDPQPEHSDYRVIRGGAFGSDTAQCRCAYRSGGAESFSNEGTGFRVVLEPEF